MKSMFNSKKAQFFIMAGIIIILVLYTLTINYNWIRETVGLTDYGELREKQGGELPKVLNRAIFITTDPSKCTEANKNAPEYKNCPIPAAEGFTTEFQKYASNIDPNFGSVLILRDPYTGDIIVKNLLAENKWIKISTKDYKGDTIKLNVPLLSESDKVKGTITIGDLGSIGVSAPITNLGEEFSKQNLGNAETMEIYIEGLETPIKVFADRIATTVSNSQDSKGNIAIDICPGGDNCK